MNTRTIAASILSLGLLASAASAANSGNFFCGKNSYYDDSSLSCISNISGKPVTEASGFLVPSQDGTVKNSEIGDFINESAADRNERSSR